MSVKFSNQIKDNKLIYIDFEFRDSNEVHPRLVCAVIFNAKTNARKRYWLFNDETEQQTLAVHLRMFNGNDYAFVSYNVVAEARCFLALGLDPVKFNWIDLMLEHRQLNNSYDRLAYGEQLIKGKVRKTVNETKWGKTEEQLARMNRSKPIQSLASAVFKFCGEMLDETKKADTIQIILTAPNFTPKQKKDIIKYCEEDVMWLPKILASMVKEYKFWWQSVDRNLKPKDGVLLMAMPMYLRGRYAALTSIMESKGYPVNRKWFLKFLKSVPEIYHGIRKDIAEQFDEHPPFVRKYKRKNEDLRMSRINIATWILEESGHGKNWMRSDKGHISLKKEAWDQFYNFKHNHPRGNYAAQICRWNSFKSSMAGFAETSLDEAKILKAYSYKDSRIRPYFNIYKAQTGRSQPPSTFFIPLKTAWSRSLIYEEDKSKFLCSIDYGSQEVLIQAIISGDKALYESYTSGDVYLAFGKLAGGIPKEATKKTHKKERDVYKTAFLSIGYGVGYRKLATRITNETGVECSESKAEQLIEDFYTVYNNYSNYLDRKKIEYGYEPFSKKPTGRGFLQLPCGWILMGDNLNPRSTGNFMIQGTGSSIMREAVWLCYQKGLPVVYTLHDALTVECRNLEDVRTFYGCMRDAFISIMATFTDNKYAKEWAKKIRLDTNCWGEHFKSSSLNTDKIKEQVIYIDERIAESFGFYSKYFLEEEDSWQNK